MECDYLVVGAGTASLSFIDTLITHSDSATVIIVDRNGRPGGHWVHAYPFVRLHQQSCSYGVNSRPLGKLRGKKQIEVFDMDDRATGHEILEYYAEVVKSFEATKRVKVFYSTEYSCEDGNHMMSSSDGTTTTISCGKLVNCLTKVEVPSMRKPYFPVDESVSMKSLNCLPEAIESKMFEKYVVIGAGKTGTDAIMYLLQSNVDPDMITWVISRDVWYFLRDGFLPKPRPKGKYWKYSCDALLTPFAQASSLKEIYLNMERAGTVGRLDPDGPFPEVYKGATIYTRELDTLRSVKNVIRLGRVTSILGNEIVLEKGTVPLVSCEDTLVVDCMTDGLYGYLDFGPDFETFKPNLIELGPVPMLFNPSLTSAAIGYLEATFHDDTVKNSFLYHPVSKQIIEDPLALFVGGVYCHFKTLEQFGKYKPLQKFILESRTNPGGFGRHGGILPLLWALLGPLQMAKKNDILIEKYNADHPNSYTGVENPYPGREEVDVSLLESALRVVGSSAKKGCFAK